MDVEFPRTKFLRREVHLFTEWNTRPGSENSDTRWNWTVTRRRRRNDRRESWTRALNTSKSPPAARHRSISACKHVDRGHVKCLQGCSAACQRLGSAARLNGRWSRRSRALSCLRTRRHRPPSPHLVQVTLTPERNDENNDWQSSSDIRLTSWHWNVNLVTVIVNNPQDPLLKWLQRLRLCNC